MKAQYKEYEEKMNKTLDSLYREFATIRAGKASPSVLDRVTGLLRCRNPNPAAGYHLYS